MTIHETTTPAQKQSFAKWLRLQITARRWTAVNLAQRSDLSITTIQNLLHAQRSPEPITCKKMASALSLPINLVYEKAGYMPARSETLSGPKRALIELVKSMPDADALRLLARSQARMVTQADRKWWA